MAHRHCGICAAIAQNEKDILPLNNTELGDKVGVSESTIRRHKHAATALDEAHGTLYASSVRDEETGTWHKYRFDVDAAEPEWPVVQPAQTVVVQLPTWSDWGIAPRDGLRLSLKCADTQIGFRRLPDGSFESFHDDTAMDVFVKVVYNEQPDEIVILGDFLDLPSQGKYIQEAGFAQTTQMALDRAYKFLAMLRAAVPNAQIVIVEGNHDKRLQSYVETNALAAFGLRKAGVPESWPVLSLPNLLRLDELDVVYYDAYPAATHWDNDNVRNIHGTRANSKGSTTAQYSNDLPHISSWVGHSHRAEITYKTVLGPRGEALETYVANPGCLCKVDGTVPSVHGALHSDGTSAKVVEDWSQGFGANLYNATESWPAVYRIKDGVAYYNGRKFTDVS